MFNNLQDIIKKIQGNILLVSVDSKIIDYFDKNEMVNLYSIESETKGNGKKGKDILKKKNTDQKKGKKISMKKLKKYFKKKSLNYIFCNIDDIMQYYKYFIKDSIYISNTTIFVYSNNKVDKEFLIERYNRYNVKINVKDYKNGYLLEIDSSKGKNNFIKDKLYFIKDTFYNIAEVIGNILTS